MWVSQLLPDSENRTNEAMLSASLVSFMEDRMSSTTHTQHQPMGTYQTIC